MPCPCRSTNHRCSRCAAAHRERCREQYRKSRGNRIEKAQARRGIADGWEERWKYACGIAARRWPELYFAWDDVRQECAVAAILTRTKDQALARAVDNRLYALAKVLRVQREVPFQPEQESS